MNISFINVYYKKKLFEEISNQIFILKGFSEKKNSTFNILAARLNLIKTACSLSEIPFFLQMLI